MSPPPSTLSDTKGRKTRDFIHVDGGPQTEDLAEKFWLLAERSYRFSRELPSEVRLTLPVGLKAVVDGNLEIIRTVFAKWCLEILILVYLKKTIGFQELKASLEAISSQVLSLKLRRLEEFGLLQRPTIAGRPPRTMYSLTPNGVIVAHLGEPVLMFLRLTLQSAGAR